MIREIVQILFDNDIESNANNLIVDLFFVKKEHYNDNNKFDPKTIILEPEEFFDRLEKSVKVKGNDKSDTSMQINSSAR